MDIYGQINIFQGDEDQNLKNKLMNEEKIISPFLTKLERTFVSARQAEKLCVMKKNSALKKLIEYLIKAFAESGKHVPGFSKAHQCDTLKAMANLIYYDMTEIYPNITIEEIRLAMMNGVRHAYGDYWSITSSSINQFVTKFLQDPDRKQAFVKQNKYIESIKEEPKKELTPEQLDELEHQSLVNCYENYKKHHEIYDFGNMCYQHAVKKGYIKASSKEKCAIFEQAMELVDKEEAEKISKFGLNRFQRSSEADLQLLYKSKAMNIALSRYFDFMIWYEKGRIDGEIDLSIPIEEQLSSE